MLRLVKQAGNGLYINPDNVLMITPTNLVATTKVFFINGLQCDFDGTIHELADILNGNGGPLLESRLIQ